MSTARNSTGRFGDLPPTPPTAVSCLHGDFSLNPTPGDSVVGGESIITRKKPESSENRKKGPGRWDLDYALCMVQTQRSSKQDQGQGRLRGLEAASMSCVQALLFDKLTLQPFPSCLKGSCPPWHQPMEIPSCLTVCLPLTTF